MYLIELRPVPTFRISLENFQVSRAARNFSGVDRGVPVKAKIGCLYVFRFHIQTIAMKIIYVIARQALSRNLLFTKIR
jgi:hypothetical protein